MLFRHAFEIRFGDVDSAGIVYYPRFAHYFHVAMEECFAQALGQRYPELLAETRVGLPAVRLEVDFVRPLRYGDRVELEVGIESIGTSSVIWTFRLEKEDGTRAAQARVVTVALALDRFEKIPVPDDLRRRLEAYRRLSPELASP